MVTCLVCNKQLREINKRHLGSIFCRGVQSVTGVKIDSINDYKNAFGEGADTGKDTCLEKKKRTCLERYGYEYATQAPVIKERQKIRQQELGSDQKRKQTCIKRYGGLGNAASGIFEKQQATMKERYGVPFAMQSEKYRYFLGSQMLRADVREKRKKIFLEKYGVSCYGVLVPSSGTRIEKLMVEGLRSRDISSFRVNKFVVCCHPDIIFDTKKVAVFCDGDFWHGNPDVFKDNELEKIMGGSSLITRVRDKKHNEVLDQNGWKVLRFWESKILNNVNSCVQEIIDVLRSRRNKKWRCSGADG